MAAVDLSQSSSPEGSPIFHEQSPGDRSSSVFGMWSINMEPRIYGMPSPAATNRSRVGFDIPKSPATGATASTPYQLPGPLQSPLPPQDASWQEKALYTVTKQLFDLQRFQTQTQQKSLSLQKATTKSKKTKESAMSLQTKDTVRTTQVLLMNLSAYDGATSLPMNFLSPPPC